MSESEGARRPKRRHSKSWEQRRSRRKEGVGGVEEERRWSPDCRGY